MTNNIASCEGCGACCEHMRTPPFVGYDDPRWNDLPANLKREIDASAAQSLEDRPELSPCIWLTPEKTCRHHARRPDVCRDFLRGSRACKEARVALSIGETT